MVSLRRLPLMVEVEVLDGLTGRKTRGLDPVLPTVVLSESDFPFQTGGGELLMGPTFGAGPPFDRRRQRGGLQRPAQPGEFGGGSAGGLLGGHHATPVARSYTARSLCSTWSGRARLVRTANRIVRAAEVIGVGDAAMLAKGAPVTAHHLAGQSDGYLGRIDPHLDPPDRSPWDEPNSHRSPPAPNDHEGDGG